MAFCFYEEPDLELDVQLDLLKRGIDLSKLPGGVCFFSHVSFVWNFNKNVSWNMNYFNFLTMIQLSPLLQTKLREVLVEKFVYPNRKYIRLPGTPKKVISFLLDLKNTSKFEMHIFKIS
jgi:hypothetical protein